MLGSITVIKVDRHIHQWYGAVALFLEKPSMFFSYSWSGTYMSFLLNTTEIPHPYRLICGYRYVHKTALTGSELSGM